MRKGMRVLSGIVAVTVALMAALILVPVSAFAKSGPHIDIYRLYNPYTGEHLYTSATGERDSLVDVGWVYEGVAWTALKAELATDQTSHNNAEPVYRLYNPYVPGGDHHYTTDKHEYIELKEVGWIQEGIAWCGVEFYNDGLDTVYRLYNPNAVSGAHHYTTDAVEAKTLIAAGWRDEGVGWIVAGQRRFLLDGTQSDVVNFAREMLGVPSDPYITYYTSETTDPNDNPTTYVMFYDDSGEKWAYCYIDPDGTFRTDISHIDWK